MSDEEDLVFFAVAPSGKKVLPGAFSPKVESSPVGAYMKFHFHELTVPGGGILRF
jgi:hypothetical protein